MKKKIKGLYSQALQDPNNVIQAEAHPEFAPGYYVSEYDEAIMLENGKVFIWGDKGWEEYKKYCQCWFDGTVIFIPLPENLRERIR